MLRAIRAEKSVGNANASSRALVCSDWVCPCVAAIASKHVRITLLNGSCAVNDHPDVWQCARSASDLSSFGANGWTRFAHSSRPARSFAISMNTFMPMPQKKDNRGANASMSRPAAKPALMYSTPSASVYANSRSAVAPASWMWYPEMEIELNFGIRTEVYSKMSLTIRMDGPGG